MHTNIDKKKYENAHIKHEIIYILDKIEPGFTQ